MTLPYQVVRDAPNIHQVSAPRRVTAIRYDDFLSRKFPPREVLLAPWLPRAGLAMIHAARGIGKTHMGLGTAWAVATGGQFLRWATPGGAFKVLLLDGELTGAMLQDRLKSVVEASGRRPPLNDHLMIAASDIHRDGLPDLANPASQNFYADTVGDADLVIVDNVSTLCRGLKENDADAWGPVQQWCLSLRRQNKSVLLIHHDGKNGGQRGTSRKEDVLDTVVGLRKPPDYRPDQGARFEIHFEKARGFFGPDAASFEVRLENGKWIESEIRSGDDIETLQTLHEQGHSIREIADLTGLAKSTVQRRLGED